MRRVLILGSSGAGKSMLAAELAGIFGLPLIHLDAHFWRPGWQESPRDEWRDRVATLLRGEAWIMDGTYAGTLPERLAAADTAILLDLPRLQCISRVVQRGIRRRGRTRPDLAPGCLEQVPDWAYLREIWSYPRVELPVVMAQLRVHALDKTVVILRSKAAIQAYLTGVSAAAMQSSRNAADAV